jgi:hypothetical protein
VGGRLTNKEKEDMNVQIWKRALFSVGGNLRAKKSPYTFTPELWVAELKERKKG